MNKQLSIVCLLVSLTQSVEAGCFSDFPGIQTEYVPPYGRLAWSPLMGLAQIHAWLTREQFFEVDLDAPRPDRFWVRGHCLAQVAPLESGDQGWLVGSEFGQALSELLEIDHAGA